MEIDSFLKTVLEQQQTVVQSTNNQNLVWRLEHLTNLERLLKENESAIIDALRKDLHKSHIESYVSELAPVYSEIKYTKKNLKRWLRPRSVHPGVLNFPSRSYCYPQPYGTSLIIGPFNYPVGLLLQPLVSSFAAGNCTILKPSEQTPEVSALLKALFDRYFTPAICTVIEGGPRIVEKIINAGINFVFFTGGKSGGSQIMKLCSDKVTPLLLELGGANPCIVDSDIALESATKRIAWGKFFNAGQTCMAPNICFVHQSIRARFVPALIKTINNFYYENSTLTKDFSSIINRSHLLRITKMMTSEGKTIFGGNFSTDSLLIEPTLLETNAHETMFLKEEIFGPILPITYYENLADLLKIIETGSTPLITYFFSENVRHIDFLRRYTKSGNLCVNGTLHHAFAQQLPFGGAGMSGFGRYHGKAGFDAFSFSRSVLMKHPRYEIPVIYPPYKTPLFFVKKVMRRFF